MRLKEIIEHVWARDLIRIGYEARGTIPRPVSLALSGEEAYVMSFSNDNKGYQ